MLYGNRNKEPDKSHSISGMTSKLIKYAVVLLTVILWIDAGATLFFPNFFAYQTYQAARSTTITDMMQCADSGYIMVGHTNLIEETMKVDRTGAKQWSYIPNDRSSVIPTSAATVTTAGKCIVAVAKRLCSSSSFCSDIVRLTQMSSQTGAIEWEQTYDLGARVQIVRVMETANGGFLVGGMIHESTTLNTDLLVFKTEGDGTLLWSKRYGMQGIVERLFIMRQTSGGEMMVLGDKDGKTWLLRMNAEGDTLWTRMYFYGATNVFHDMQTTDDGKYLCSGISTEVSGQSDLWVLKIDDLGEALWSKHFFKGKALSAGYLVTMPQGGISIACGVDKKSVLLKLSDQGDSLWTLRYGFSGTYSPSRLLLSPQERFVIAGTYSPWRDSTCGYFLAFKSEEESRIPQGFDNWEVLDSTIGAFESNIITKIAIDSSNHIWCAVRDYTYTSAYVHCQTDTGWRRHADIPRQQIMKITVSSKGKLWFAGDLGIYGFDGTVTTNTKIQLQAFGVESINDTVVYIGGSYGLSTLRNGVLTALPEATGMYSSPSVHDIAVDRQSRVWFQPLYGVMVKDGATYTMYASSNSPLPSSAVRRITTDGAGDVWILTDLGLTSYRNGVWETFDSTKTALGTSAFSAYTISRSGVPVLASDRGFSIVGTSMVYDYFNSPLPSNIIYCMVFDRDDNLWIGTDNGLVCIKAAATTVSPYTVFQPHRNDPANSAYFARPIVRMTPRYPVPASAFDLLGRKARGGEWFTLQSASKVLVARYTHRGGPEDRTPP